MSLKLDAVIMAEIITELNNNAMEPKKTGRGKQSRRVDNGYLSYTAVTNKGELYMGDLYDNSESVKHWSNSATIPKWVEQAANSTQVNDRIVSKIIEVWEKY